MKRFSKIFITLVATVMLCMATFSFGCTQKITKLTINLQVYNYESTAQMKDHVISADLYNDLAPNTVSAITGYANDGFYDNAIFYKIVGESSAYTVGDLFVDADGDIIQKIKPQIVGEFANNNVVGSDLTNKLGSIGLWRSWYESDDNVYRTSSEARNSGRATMYLPTAGIAGYDGYFCVFATFDPEETDNKSAVDALSLAFSSGNYKTFIVYYTGEYDANKPNENYGLTFNCVPEADFEDVDEDTVFKPEGAQLECYGKYTIQVPVNETGDFAAVISSVRVTKK